jgi:hypothetical protein
MNDEVRERRVEDAGGIELLAGDSCADDGENARTDDCANAESGKRPRTERLFERVFGLL